MPLPFELSVVEYAALRKVEAPRAKNVAPILLDVRETEEYATAKISGSVLIPLGEISARAQEALPDKTAHIVVHCHHGMRSARAVEYLQHIGYTNVQNLAGGIDAWSREIDPSVPIY